MAAAPHVVSATLLRQVLEGASVAAAARSANMSPNAAEQRIKKLARDLQVAVGVERVRETAMPTMRMLRAHRAEYLEALEHFEPDRVRRDDAAVTEADLRLILERIDLHHRQHQRDRTLVLVLFATAVRPAELLRLEVQDYLAPDGTARLVSMLRPDAAGAGPERPLFFVNSQLRLALDDYLQMRAQRQGRGTAGAYRGLDGHSPLLLARPEPTAQPFTRKSLYETLRRIFRLAGKPNLTPLSARQYVANRLAGMRVDERDIARALGLRRVEAVRALLTRTGLQEGMRLVL